jgi:hypothetical protein
LLTGRGRPVSVDSCSSRSRTIWTKPRRTSLRSTSLRTSARCGRGGGCSRGARERRPSAPGTPRGRRSGTRPGRAPRSARSHVPQERKWAVLAVTTIWAPADRRGEDMAVLRRVVHLGDGACRAPRPKLRGTRDEARRWWCRRSARGRCHDGPGGRAAHPIADLLRPDGLVVAHGRHGEQHVAQPLGVEHVGVEHGAERLGRAAHRTPRSSSAAARAVSSESRPSRSLLKAWRAATGTRWRLPFLRYGSLPVFSSRVR